MSQLNRNRKVTFYHASPRRFRHGDLLTGGHDGGCAAGGRPHPAVCMTTSPAIHITIAQQAVAGNWFVYEVSPIGTAGHCSGNGEVQAKVARVIRCIGRAASFLCKPSPGSVRRLEDGAAHFYSIVPRRPMRGVKVK